MDRCKKHPLINIITIAILAVICGADNWVDVEDFGKAKKDWLATFLDLSKDIPSHDTFGRVFSILNPDEFHVAFLSWVRSVVTLSDGAIVAIDGKVNRRSHSKGVGKDAIKLVSAFSSENGIALGQAKVPEGSNEKTAIEKLLKILDLSGCIATIDAAGCYADILEGLTNQGADYVVSVKNNQPHLYEDVKRVFKNTDKHSLGYTTTEDRGHGREEKREAWVISNPELLDTIRNKKKWKSVSSVIMVTSRRKTKTRTSKKETRYYISSLKTDDAPKLLQAVRRHWSIENALHWILDIAFREDESRIRIGHGQENFSLLRKMALNLTKLETSLKVGRNAKRKMAGWDLSYLLKLLQI